VQLRKGLSEKTLLLRIGRFNRLRFVGERGLGFYLLDFDRRGLYRKHGFSKTTQFSQLRFYIPPRMTRELMRIDRALEELPQIDDAFAEGKISWSAVREISRVATRETEKEWLDLALTTSMRKIEQAVSRAQHGDRPPKDPYGLSHTKLKVLAELAIEDHALWQAAFDRAAANHGGELDAATVLLVMAKSYLEQPLNQKEAETRHAFTVVYHRCTDCERAWIQTEDGPEGIPAAKVAARQPLARVVKLPSGAREPKACATTMSSNRGGDGAGCGCGAGGVVAAIATNQTGACKAVGDGVAAHRDDLHGSNTLLPAGRSTFQRSGGSRIVSECPEKKATGTSFRASVGTHQPGNSTHVGHRSGASGSEVLPQKVPKELRDKPNTPSLRQKVLSRDGARCRAPGCTNRADLICHHVVLRSEGGTTEIGNEIALCRSCHSLVHEGVLQVRGDASLGLKWLGADGKELSRFDGGWRCVRLAVDRSSSKDDPRGFVEDDSVLRSLDEIPDHIDTAWWRKYRHNLTFRNGRLCLESGK